MNPNIDLPILSARTMDKKSANILSLSQWGVILGTNAVFVYKYILRIGINPIIATVVFCLLFVGAVWVYSHKIANFISERIAKGLSIGLTIGIIGVIACSIFLIDPLSIGVDRWSATTYFLDGLTAGVYPYGVHTHMFENNYPSPFPLWHYLNIPFWLIGDVGWIQAVMILVFLGCIYVYFRSWRAVLGAILILGISPAYWWEIATRSDGLSNALLVCSTVLLIEWYGIKMEKHWWLLAIIAGCFASTRLSAVIPVALYLFKPWLDTTWKKELGFIGIAAGIVIFFFLPYILWDTETWIFFQRNPFMSQTEPGSPWILGVMVLIAIFVAYKKQTLYYYFSTTSVFMFAFMLITQLGVVWRSGGEVTLYDPNFDISYFTLAFPFAIAALIMETNYEKSNSKK